MVNIDTVYQTVLALANKEQRGYVTPQEFNLFANQAQVEIFEQYFYDLNQFLRVPGNQSEYSDMINILEEKIGFFKNIASLTYDDVNKVFILPNDLYRLGTIFHGGIEQNQSLTSQNIVEEVDEKELSYLNRDFDSVSKLLTPRQERPIYTKRKNTIKVYPTSLQQNVRCSYVKNPNNAMWGYVVVNEKAMWNPSASQHFELHPAERTELVYKILKYAGISIKQEDIMMAGQGMEMAKVTQEKQ